MLASISSSCFCNTNKTILIGMHVSGNPVFSLTFQADPYHISCVQHFTTTTSCMNHQSALQRDGTHTTGNLNLTKGSPSNLFHFACYQERSCMKPEQSRSYCDLPMTPVDTHASVVIGLMGYSQLIKKFILTEHKP